MKDYSPMMGQYFALKEKYPNTILFFRLGDFYEMFFDDAVLVSRELDLTLTGRPSGQGERAPMCGVPFHSYETYLARLVAKGYKVAICEQMEDPKTAKGLVQRAIVRVVTPGTVLEGTMLDESKNNYLCSVCVQGERAGLCFADVSTGKLMLAQLQAKRKSELTEQIRDRLARYQPREVLLESAAARLSGLGDFLRDRLHAAVELQENDEQYQDIEAAGRALLTQFGKDREELGLLGRDQAVFALAVLLDYLHRTQISGLERLEEPKLEQESSLMGLDLNTRRNLELTETLRSKEKRGSLLWVLDRTKTAMGKRMIKTWLEQPLVDPAKITLRQNAVEELVSSRELLDELQERLTGIHDLERLMTKVVYGSANARELRALCAAAQRLPGVKVTLMHCGATLLQRLNLELDPLDDIAELIERAIVDDPPFSIREGGMIRDGYNDELDEINLERSGGAQLLADIETRERERTGIPKLRTGYNKVFGYFIEVSNSYKDQVPADYIRKQTLTNGERYITPELKELEGRILSAQDRGVALEGRLFEELRVKVASQLDRVQRSADAVAALDVLASFALVSAQNGYTRPAINLSGKLYLKDSRHPVVELLLKNAPFVPNDVDMDMNDNRVAIITGPNMAGKSTYMRQTALCVILAQIGCFVPAGVAEIGIVDKIFTRVGASDDLAAGQSTFMVEMSEVADILKHATPRSLVIFDEIGRGTSTFDGMSIARAVLEYVHDKKRVGAKTLFATHYHELTALESQLPGVKNFNIAVKKKGDDITFLRRIVPGGADDSFGIQVAKLAGVPDPIIQRAKEVLAELEQQGGRKAPVGEESGRWEEPVQLVMEGADAQVLAKLRALDVNNLTPMQALNALFELRAILK